MDRRAKAKGEALVGQRVEILCEGLSKTSEERLMGRSPGNKIVIFEGSERSSGFSLYGDPAVL